MFLKPNFPHFYSILQFWDMGYGFELPDLYKTGYAVLALSIVTGLALAAM
jgi:succinate dehydrogenase/fumarate reductase cytochrome b subunit